MKIKKSRIEEIIKEELAIHIRELLVLEKVEVATADDENDAGEEDVQANDVAPTVGAKKEDDPPDGDQKEPEEKPTDAGEEPKATPTGDEEIPGEEVPTGDDPSDDEIAADIEEPEPEDEEDIGGDISNEIAGKQIQSMTMEPESKMMAGAREIVIQFESDPHPLKILLGKSGMIKFVYKGSIHNEL